MSFDLVTASAILFSKNSPVLWTIFLEIVFGVSSPVSNNFFQLFCYLYFLAKDNNPYPETYFLVFGSTEYYRIAEFEVRVISVYYKAMSN